MIANLKPTIVSADGKLSIKTEITVFVVLGNAIVSPTDITTSFWADDIELKLNRISMTARDSRKTFAAKLTGAIIVLLKSGFH